MAMDSPPHPGEFIVETCMEPFGLGCRYLASKPNVAASSLNRVLKKQSDVSPEMALRLSRELRRSPESWLSMQDNYDLWQARKQVKLGKIKKISTSAA